VAAFSATTDPVARLALVQMIAAYRVLAGDPLAR
jgi:hypothetical protein